MAYQFRIAIEPAAILQPGYTVDEEAFRRARGQQQALLDGDYRTLSRTKLFEINSQFHEMIVAGIVGTSWRTDRCSASSWVRTISAG